MRTPNLRKGLLAAVAATGVIALTGPALTSGALAAGNGGLSPACVNFAGGSSWSYGLDTTTTTTGHGAHKKTTTTYTPTFKASATRTNTTVTTDPTSANCSAVPDQVITYVFHILSDSTPSGASLGWRTDASGTYGQDATGNTTGISATTTGSLTDVAITFPADTNTVTFNVTGTTSLDYYGDLNGSSCVQTYLAAYVNQAAVNKSAIQTACTTAKASVGGSYF